MFAVGIRTPIAASNFNKPFFSKLIIINPKNGTDCVRINPIFKKNQIHEIRYVRSLVGSEVQFNSHKTDALLPF